MTPLISLCYVMILNPKTLSMLFNRKFSHVKDFVIFYTSQLSKKNSKTRAMYEKAAADLLEKKGKSSIPYDIYKNRLMFWFLSCSLIIAIQTHIPSFEVNNSRLNLLNNYVP